MPSISRLACSLACPPAHARQSIATLWTLLTAGIHGGKPTCARPLILCPASLVANWGAELTRWLEGRVAPVVVDDTRGEKVGQMRDACVVRGA